MNSPFRSITKRLVMVLPYTREQYFQRTFLKRSPSCKGIYASFAEAIADIPPTGQLGHHHPELTDAQRNAVDYFNAGDYPMLAWLRDLLPTTRLVFELGGNLGLGFYAYRKHMAYPPDLRWVICELPGMVRQGRELARERHETQLSFTEERELPENPDIYLTSGTLQFIEDSFSDILQKLRRLPPHVFINRVAFTGGTPYITLQNAGLWFSPYKVDNLDAFLHSMKFLGYEIVDQWAVERPVSFFLHPDHEPPRYHGAYFRLR